MLQVVQSLGKLEFTLADVYAHAAALAKLHPNNAHVRDKIRQQLQVLRDLSASSPSSAPAPTVYPELRRA